MCESRVDHSRPDIKPQDGLHELEATSCKQAARYDIARYDIPSAWVCCSQASADTVKRVKHKEDGIADSRDTMHKARASRALNSATTQLNLATTVHTLQSCIGPTSFLESCKLAVKHRLFDAVSSKAALNRALHAQQ